MPRRPLIRTNQYPYHVTIRSNNKEWFNLPLEVVWGFCLEALASAHRKHPIKLQAFVLMSNHYHALIWTPDCNLDRFMFEFNRSLSLKIRKRSDRINRIFGDRYHWSLIQNEAYYLRVIRYIYQNPLRAKIVTRSEDYPFSTLYYSVSKKSFPIEIFKGLDTVEKLCFFNEVEEDDKAKLLANSLRRSVFKAPKSPTSRRVI